MLNINVFDLRAKMSLDMIFLKNISKSAFSFLLFSFLNEKALPHKHEEKKKNIDGIIILM